MSKTVYLLAEVHAEDEQCSSSSSLVEIAITEAEVETLRLAALALAGDFPGLVVFSCFAGWPPAGIWVLDRQVGGDIEADPTVADGLVEAAPGSVTCNCAALLRAERVAQPAADVDVLGAGVEIRKDGRLVWTVDVGDDCWIAGGVEITALLAELATIPD